MADSRSGEHSHKRKAGNLAHLKSYQQLVYRNFGACLIEETIPFDMYLFQSKKYTNSQLFPLLENRCANRCSIVETLRSGPGEKLSLELPL